jgi:hypothetical protein
MAGRNGNNSLTVEYNRQVIATVHYSSHAAADGPDAGTVRGLPRPLFTRNHAITVMVLAERLAG